MTRRARSERVFGGMAIAPPAGASPSRAKLADGGDVRRGLLVVHLRLAEEQRWITVNVKMMRKSTTPAAP